MFRERGFAGVGFGEIGEVAGVGATNVGRDHADGERPVCPLGLGESVAHTPGPQHLEGLDQRDGPAKVGKVLRWASRPVGDVED
ncbi:MAG: hypothetical protein K1X38_04570 [Microthrixaceae bacterium]|nr:hypothetical protein [Microthrixaceae bacterium]